MKAHTMTKKLVTLLLAVCLLVPSCLVLPASAAVSNDINDILFDYEYYYNKYPDLQRAFGKNASALYNHYLTYGKKEGRCPSSLFDPVYYVNKYSDLKAAFGNDYTKLYQHFVTYGIKEGRQASASFNVTIYKNNYADLRNAFGTSSSDNWKYLQHWRNYGQSENRNAVSAISSSTTSTSTSTSTSSSGTTGWVKTSGGNLYLRSSASTSGKALASMPNGSQVTILQWGSSWSKITYNGTTGYASSTYLTTTKPTDNESAVLNKINSLLATSTYQVGTQYAGPYASEQCKGFAKSIHQQIFGYNIGSTKSKPYNYQISYSSSNTICRGSTTNLSASNLQSIFANGRAGDIIQLRRSHTGSHTMVLLSHNNSGITVVEANLDGRNTISKNTYTWAQLKSANVGLSLYSASAYYVH
jgi:hypothetical protein